MYVYPLQKFVDEHGIPIGGMMSQEMYSILEAILESRYYTPDPSQACILVPSIDTLNQNRFRPKQTSQALKSLPLYAVLFHLVLFVSHTFKSTFHLFCFFILLC